MFTPIIETLTRKGRGIHAYAAVAEVALAQAEAHPDQATAFYLLAMISEEFVDLHERMPLSTPELAAFDEQFEAAVAALASAQETGDATNALRALNAVSSQAVARRKG